MLIDLLAIGAACAWTYLLCRCISRVDTAIRAGQSFREAAYLRGARR